MSESKFIQFFIKFLDNKTITLQFPTHHHETLTSDSIKHHIETLTLIPIHSQTLILNGKILSNSTLISPQTLNLSTIHLTQPLLGGKGGFGSLLRGAATKAGQKKTNNFDACRDMSGRRLRHVNAEKRIEEWKGELEERKMEKVAEAYLKKMAKAGRGGKKEEGAEKYVQKYREDSARCVEEVERSVRESMAGGKKRKVMDKLKGKEGVDAKKLKIWMGKRKMGESDSDTSESDSGTSDDDEESNDTDTENEKSVVINNGNQSDSSKNGICVSISIQQSNREQRDGDSSDSGSDEEKVTATEGSSASPGTIGCENHENGSVSVYVSIIAEKNSTVNLMVSTASEIVADASEPNLSSEQLLSTSSLKELNIPQLSTAVPEAHGALESKSASLDNGTAQSSSVTEPLNFDDYNSASELEILGMERLKSELQSHGLKFGGNLQQRAARLFLLKTMPAEKLPKKLLAKK